MTVNPVVDINLRCFSRKSGRVKSTGKGLFIDKSKVVQSNQGLQKYLILLWRYSKRF